jgi:putative polymerase
VLAASSVGQGARDDGAAVGEIAPAGLRAWIGGGLVVAAAIFNMGLCLLNSHGLAISATHVIASELIIVGAATVLSYRIVTLQASVFFALLIAYFCTIWLFTGTTNTKVARDVLIPIVFLLCGTACAGSRDADRIVYILVLVVFGVALFEWFWLDQFLKVFDVIGYYLAKGRIEESQTWMEINVAMNGMRPEAEGRTLFPILGFHRVSSIFLEPISTGNFSVIAFAWLLVRFNVAPLKNLAFMTLTAAVIILADDRLATATCLVLVIVRIMPLLPATTLWMLPLISITGLIVSAAIFPSQEVDQSIYGRLVGSGRLIASFDIDDWFGISHRPLQSMLDVDSGYAYAIYAVGLPGLLILWTAFSFARDYTADGARYRMLLGFYIAVAFCVSQAAFSIKTAALAWFLLGASQNAQLRRPRTGSVPDLSFARLQPHPADLQP